MEINKIALVEALLFSSDKPIDIKTIIKACKLNSEEEAEKIIEELKMRYSSPTHSITINTLSNKRFLMQLKPEYVNLVKKFIKKPLFKKSILKTLSYIAYNQPVYQSRVVSVRGSQAYKHIKFLMEKGYIEGEKIGRTLLLKTSQLFADYFGIENDPKTIKKLIINLMKEKEIENNK
jgi:segregation and condensation protein B